MLIVGVVGQIASGKGVLVKYLTEKLNFVCFSLSSIVHNEQKKKGKKEFTRQMLQDMGNELRRRYGNDTLALRIIKAIKKQKKDHIVVEGIRNPGEIELFKKNRDFILIGVKANRKLRYKRLLSRGKQWDPKNRNDFLKVDRRDLGVGQDKSGQQVGKCLAYCDFILTNNKDLVDFQRKIHALVSTKLHYSNFIL